MNAFTEDILGYAVEKRGLAGCVDDIAFWVLKGGRPRWLACLNPHSYAVSRGDPLSAEALHAADFLIPDGVGIVMASRLLGGEITERVTGYDVFTALHERLNIMGGAPHKSEPAGHTSWPRVFFLGASVDTLAAIRERMGKDYPHVVVAGTYSPPFKKEYTKEETDAMVDAVNRTAPDVLWVGMTAPKQEKWIHQNKDRLKVKFAGAIGAVFDFYAGRVKRSHPVFQRMGLEWLPRLIQEPLRLWKRMFISAPIFIFHVLKAKFTR